MPWLAEIWLPVLLSSSLFAVGLLGYQWRLGRNGLDGRPLPAVSPHFAAKDSAHSQTGADRING